ncbi:hypothetical protein HDU76_010484, partial [Blyttiomyces sp. JEL0837]
MTVAPDGEDKHRKLFRFSVVGHLPRPVLLGIPFFRAIKGDPLFSKDVFSYYFQPPGSDKSSQFLVRMTFLTRFEDETTIDPRSGITYDDFSRLTITRMHSARDFVRQLAEADQSTRQVSYKARPSHEFQIGDYAWLAAPLRTRHTSQGMLSEKFQYRWIGPVRIVGIHGTDSQSSIDIVETYPGYEIVRRTVHISRLRPYTYLEPEDNAELATLDSQPDIETEIQQWTDARLLRRKPRGEQPTDTGLHRRIMQALYPDFTQDDVDNPEFRIDYIVKFRYNKDRNEYEYLTKWEGWTHRFNTWQRESDMHPDLISEYWDGKRTTQSRQFKLRQAWLRSQRRDRESQSAPQVNKQSKLVVEIPRTYETSAWDSSSSLVAEVVNPPDSPIHILIHMTGQRMSKIVRHKVLYE